MKVLGSIAAAQRGTSEDHLRCFRQLVGPEQHWIAACREVVATRRSELLDLPTGTPLKWAAVLIEENLPLDASSITGRAKAIASVAQAILLAETEPVAAKQLMVRAAEDWSNTRISETPLAWARTSVSIGSTGVTVSLAFEPLFDALAVFPPTLAAILTDLTYDLASSRLPSDSLVTLPIVLDHSSGGLVADLTLEKVNGLPPVCYPDPARMAFYALGKEFVQALAHAEERVRSTQRLSDLGAVRWRLSPRSNRAREDISLHALRGGSVGLGFALGLHQLADPVDAPLQRHWAATGALRDNDGTLGSVQGYARKLAAADKSRLGLIYPVADQEQVSHLLQASQIQTRAVATVDEALAFLSGSERPPCPYRGLNQFSEADVHFFFGRDAEIDEIRTRVAACPRLLALLGSSGSGKSSLIHAGLLTGIAARHPEWQVRIARLGEHPFSALAEIGLVNSGGDLVDTLKHELERKHPGTHLLLVLDQFEEVLALCLPDERQRFLDQLTEILRCDLPVTLVLVMRNDFYSQLNRLAPGIMGYVVGNQMHLPDTPDRASLEEMIVLPALATGVDLEAGLPERISSDLLLDRALDESSVGGILPILAFTMARLWEESSTDSLSHATYHAIGRAANVLVEWSSQAIAQLSKPHQRLANQIILELVQPGDVSDGLPDSRRRRLISDLYRSVGEDAELTSTLHHLIRSRLLVSGRVGERETIELIHDVLVREWDHLRDLIDQNRRFLAWKRDCESQMQRWQDAGEQVTRLLPREEIVEAERWQREHLIEERLLAYINMSAAYRDKQRRNTRLGLVAAFVALMIVVIFTSYAYVVTNASLRRSETERMALTARNSLATAPEEAIRQAIAAFNKDANPFTEETLHVVAQATSVRAILSGHQESVLAVAVSPDGRTLATASSDQTIILWDLPEGQVRQRLEGHFDQVNTLAFSPDGRLLASAAGPTDPSVRLWDVARGQVVGALEGHIAGIVDLAFSLDGSRLASIEGLDDIAVNGNRSVRVWDVASRTEQAMLTLEEQELGYVEFDATGKTLIVASEQSILRWDFTNNEIFPIATIPMLREADIALERELLVLASKDGSLHLMNLHASESYRTFQADNEPVTTVVFSPDEQTFLSGHNDGIVRLWDVETGTVIHTYAGHTDEIMDLAFTPDGQTIISGGRDKQARIWAREPGAELHELVHVGDGATQSLTFSPDGSTLAIASSDGHVYRQVIGSGETAQELIGAGESPTAIAFSNDGTMLAIGYDDGAIVLCDPTTGRLLDRLEGHIGAIQVLRFHPSRPLLASISTDDTLRLWDQRANWQSQAIKAHSFDPVGLVFSPDGTVIFTAGRDQFVRRWTVAGGQADGEPFGLDAVLSALTVDAAGSIYVGLNSEEVVILTPQGNQQSRMSVSSIPLELVITPDQELITISKAEAARYIADQPMRYMQAERPITAAALHPDGQLLALGDADGTVRLILIDPTTIEELLEDRLRIRE